MAAPTPPSSRVSSSSPVPEGTYRVAPAPCCSCAKVIEVALFILSAVAITVLYLLKGGFVSYVPIGYSTGIASLIAFVYSCCSESEEGTRIYVEVKGQKNLVVLDNIVAVEDNGIYCVPKDGSCLFHSVLASLKLLGKDNLPQDTTAMRQAVVRWMRANVEKDETLKINLLTGSTAHLEAKLKDAQDSEASMTFIRGKSSTKQSRAIRKQINKVKNGDTSHLPKYFEEMATSAFGTNAEIYAMTKIYQVAISAAGGTLGSEYINNGRILLAYDAQGVHYNFCLPTPAVK